MVMGLNKEDFTDGKMHDVTKFNRFKDKLFSSTLMVDASTRFEPSVNLVLHTCTRFVMLFQLEKYLVQLFTLLL